MAEHGFSDAARNAKCDAQVNLVNGGKLRLREGTTTLADIALDATNAFEAAGTSAVGVSRALGDDNTNPIGALNPLTGTGSAAGDCDNFQVLNSSDAVIWGGDAGVAGSSTDAAGDPADPALVLVNPSIADTQPIVITDLRYTEPATSKSPIP